LKGLEAIPSFIVKQFEVKRKFNGRELDERGCKAEVSGKL